MKEVQKFIQEIDLLSPGRSADTPTPRWLATGFDEVIWKIVLDEKGSRSLDFRVRLDDGSMLTSPEHAELINTFKLWIVRSVDGDQRAIQPTKGASISRRISVTLELIDYFLVRAREFQLSKFGISLITPNDISVMMEELSKSSFSSFTVYRWPSLLKGYLDKNCTTECLEQVLAEWSLLSQEFVSEDKYLMPVGRSEVMRYRAFLWSQGYYKKRAVSDCDGAVSYTLNTAALSRVVLAHTLKGFFQHPKPPELEVGPPQLGRRGALAIPVKASGPQPLPRAEVLRYAASLNELANIDNSLIGFSIDDVTVAKEMAVNGATGTGRFRTLPHGVVVHALRNSLEFFLRYGDDLLAAYVKCCSLKAQKPRLTMDQSVAAVFSAANYSSLGGFEIDSWSQTKGTQPVQHRQYFGCEGEQQEPPSRATLYELLLVLFGAIHITIGALSARRISEILSLPVDQCLSQSGTFLIFYNRKSGAGTYRSKETRPIPEIAARMIRSVQKLQNDLIGLGYLNETRSLVAFPLAKGPGLVADRTVINHSHVDCFCDYFETPGEGRGTRFYIRTHQLRRFFAMAFFWSGTPAGEDTLSWFLGHTDASHLYHYISEETSGQVLRSVKAVTIAEMARQDAGLKAELDELVRRHFKVAKLILLSESEMTDYLETLLLEEEVEVEPQFFETAEGQRYRVCVRIRGCSNS